MFTNVLVANRGEIARRIITTLRKMGILTVAVYSDADRMSPHILEAHRSVYIGPAPVLESYLNNEAILKAAIETGAEAIHPGYGFLSENAAFAESCEKAGITFIGPTPDQLRSFGLKHRARTIAKKTSVPLLSGSGLLKNVSEAQAAAKTTGYPLMLKSTAGGGGIGMTVCRNDDELTESFERIQRLGTNNFGDAGIFVEKYIEQARHVEVQIFGDGNGNVVVFGDRDCSLQRRNQKVLEETPAPNIPQETRDALHAAALRLTRSVNYRSAGTVEFILDTATGDFYFLEVNTRLQVEHTVTEETFGIDLVEWMVLLAAKKLEDISTLSFKQCGAAIQVRIYAEDPGSDFRPTGGLLTEVVFPEDIRVDSWIETGTEVTSFYDPLLAKIIVKGKNREDALMRMEEALKRTKISGIETNLDYLKKTLGLPQFQVGKVYTSLLKSLDYRIKGVDVLSPGIAASIQDWPGRTGFWQVGVPPSGPMDSLSFRIGNRILGNPESAAGLEITHGGVSLHFRASVNICLTGAEVSASIIEKGPVRFWTPIAIEAGEILELETTTEAGQRSYLLIDGGFDVPKYLGSRSTFTLGIFGGHGGRNIRTGDVLRFFGTSASPQKTVDVPKAILPRISNQWEIGVLYGPHGAPDYFTDDYMKTFFQTQWEVHFNSDRTGIRLIGPSPKWSRPDGGEAGLHPSNIHDNPYMIGAVDFTGDMPVILGPDGPSLGGFVCPVTIATAEQWKIGQLKPGDKILFKALSERYARDLYLHQEESIRKLSQGGTASLPMSFKETNEDVLKTLPVIKEFPGIGQNKEAVCRRSGDSALLVELGKPILDIATRFHIHALMLYLEQRKIPGIRELTPGIRSLQIQYDPNQLDSQIVTELVREGLNSLDDFEDKPVPSRIVYLPLSWDDESTQLAIEKYSTTVRPGAPWCPSNIEFIRRINGLDSVEQVKDILFSASYLVMGLGDVYLGAPVATPVNPSHRLVTTKYNPARTWTPENAVGIGGAYLCVYGMEGPGGYQFVGRTLQMWNRYHKTSLFQEGKPWLLRFFDQIRFFPVEHHELMSIRRDFPRGLYSIKVEETSFSLSDYNQLLKENQGDITAFQKKQKEAFSAERKEWERSGQAKFSSELVATTERKPLSLPEGCIGVETPVTGNIWKKPVRAGSEVQKGDTMIIIESMKMEISVSAPCSGIVEEILCVEGDHIPAGDIIASIRPAVTSATRGNE